MSNTFNVHILYIEDDLPLCDLFKMTVEAHGYSVDVAYNAEDGMAMHAANPYDVVAIDHQLPDMMGIDVARKLLAENPDLPVVMITGYGNERVAAEALALGVFNYVIKGSEKIYMELLPNIIGSALKRSAERQDKINAEAALKESDKRYRQIVQIFSDWVWEMDAKLRFSYFSEGFQRLTGINPKFILGKTRQEISSPEDLTQSNWLKHLAHLVERKEFQTARSS